MASLPAHNSGRAAPPVVSGETVAMRAMRAARATRTAGGEPAHQGETATAQAAPLHAPAGITSIASQSVASQSVASQTVASQSVALSPSGPMIRQEQGNVTAGLAHATTSGFLAGEDLIRLAMVALGATLAGSCLAAYEWRGIPIPWIARCIPIAMTMLVLLRTRMLRVPGSMCLAGLLLWCFVITAANIIHYDYQALMPAAATTSYSIFISLRFVAWISFAAQLYLVWWLLDQGRVLAVARLVTIIGMLAAGMAVYVYVAQVYGLPEPPRTRIGSAGFEQSTTFGNYAFHRAMGTFREPAEMASWLVVPLFLSFFASRRLRDLAPSMIIGAAILLSGSLAAIVGSLLGLLLTVGLLRPWHLLYSPRFVRTACVLGASMAAFSLLAVANEGGNKDLIATLGDRMGTIWDEGLMASNRGYIYEYLLEQDFPWWGVGFGNQNILFAFDSGIGIVESLLSLYFNVLYSAGVVGLVLLAAFLAQPVWLLVRQRRALAWNADLRALVAVAAGYLSWAVMYGFRSEEPTEMFAVIYPLAAFVAVRYRDCLRSLDA